eukprot:352641-Amphidinium_carterae.1
MQMRSHDQHHASSLPAHFRLIADSMPTPYRLTADSMPRVPHHVYIMEVLRGWIRWHLMPAWMHASTNVPHSAQLRI